jgi:WXG100 family type VII secretion target
MAIMVDIDELMNLSQQFQNNALKLQELTNELSGLVDSLPNFFTGAAADAFTEQFQNVLRPAFVNGEEALNTVSGQARQIALNMQEQDDQHRNSLSSR